MENSTAASSSLWQDIYRHERIDNTKHEIRLVKLLPPDQSCTSDTRIRCEVSHHTLGPVVNTAPPYTAVSYEWGEDSLKLPIYLNGLVFHVRQNLYNLLCAMHEAGDYVGRYLWIDQLCIDQEHVDERNRQVALMSAIYSQAEQVYA